MLRASFEPAVEHFFEEQAREAANHVAHLRSFRNMAHTLVPGVSSQVDIIFCAHRNRYCSCMRMLFFLRRRLLNVFAELPIQVLDLIATCF